MSNKQIKGLTVEIGGNVTKLTEALSTVDARSKSLNGQLGEVNRLLKLDPSNTELLAQKQGVLSNAISNTKERLEILKKAQAEMEQEAKTDDASREKYEALRREIMFTENDLGKYQMSLHACEKQAEQAARENKEFGDKAEAAAKDVAELEQKTEALEGSMSDAKGEVAEAAGALGALGAAGVAAAGGLTAAAMGYEDALKNIQARTGATAAQMQGISEVIDALHADGYGEDLDDLAATVSTIVQSTGEVDPDPLRRLAESAIVLRDSFDMDTAEQMRAVTQMQKQFGVTAAEAYNLIAEGAQKGLNRNGDLLDVVNEYSNHFAALGYSGQDFFVMLENGVKTGVFSVDKLGDAWKEFGIRTRDGSESTLEAFATLGMNGERLSAMFSAGGAEARQACEEVVSALFAMEDPLLQNQVGVALFGTMWEDLGKDALQALSDTKGELKSTRGAIEDIKAIKMDAASQEWKKLGRTAQQEVLLPLGNKLLPTAKKLLSFVSANIDKLLPLLKKVGAVLVGMYAGNKVGQMITSVGGLIKSYKSLKNAVTAANAAMSSNAVGLLCTAIGGLIGLLSSLSDEAEEAAEKQRELMASYKEAQKTALETQQARAEAAASIEAEYDGYRELVKELDKLVDADGRVMEGYEDRVNYILRELSKATGEEIKMVGGVIEKYDEFAQSIENVILKKQAEAYLTSQSGGYEDAKGVVNSMETDENGNYVMGSQAAYESAKQAIREREAKYEADLARFQDAYAEIKASPAISGDALPTIINQMENLKREFEQEIEVLQAAADTALLSYDVNKATIRQYEGVQNASYSEDTDSLRDALQTAADGFMTAADSSLLSLKEQYAHEKEIFDNLSKWSKQEGSTVTQDDLNRAQERTAEAYKQMRLAESQEAQKTTEAIRTIKFPDGEKLKNASLMHYERLSGIMDDSPLISGRGAIEVHDEQEDEIRRLLSRQELTMVQILESLWGLDLTVNLDGEVVAKKLISHVDAGLGRVVHSANRGSLTAERTLKE